MLPPGKNRDIAHPGLLILIIVLVFMFAVIFFLSPPTPGVPEEPLTIGSGTLDSSVLSLAAGESGYFREQGLNVTTRVYPAGMYAMKEPVSGNADFTFASEFAGVTNRRSGKTPVFVVQDNGIGTDPRYLERIYNLFEKMNPSCPGSGFGPIIVRRIIEVHGGKILAISEGPGKGTTFRFTLPGRTAGGDDRS